MLQLQFNVDLSPQTAVSCQLYKVSGRNVHTAHGQLLPWKEFDSCQTLQLGMNPLQKDLPIWLNGTQDHPVQCACKHCSIFTSLPVGWWETRLTWQRGCVLKCHLIHLISGATPDQIFLFHNICDICESLLTVGSHIGSKYWIKQIPPRSLARSNVIVANITDSYKRCLQYSF